MRKVRHKNVVQFIGACTRRPNLCIVFEFMAGGSIYDYMRKVQPAFTIKQIMSPMVMHLYAEGSQQCQRLPAALSHLHLQNAVILHVPAYPLQLSAAVVRHG